MVPPVLVGTWRPMMTLQPPRIDVPSMNATVGFFGWYRTLTGLPSRRRCAPMSPPLVVI
jgi:hypothetical protein